MARSTSENTADSIRILRLLHHPRRAVAAHRRQRVVELSVGDLSFAFHLNPGGTRRVAPITLVEWEPFRSTNTVPGREGQHILLECPLVYDETEEGKLADRSGYIRSLDYFLNHRTAIQHNVLAACVTFVQQLYAVSVKYEVERVELARVASAEDLRSLIDLSYVRLFPYHNLGVPYIGLDFECNWLRSIASWLSCSAPRSWPVGSLELSAPWIFLFGTTVVWYDSSFITARLA
jgi:hypothetical protein